jgi:uncharacterized coiled-coil protein SlyX
MQIGSFHIGWLPLEPKRQELKLLKKIMASQKVITEDVVKLTETLTQTNAKLAIATTLATKIGTETDTLSQRIKDLEDALANQDNASLELVAAVEALKVQAGNQTTAIDALSTGLTAVDEKVPDQTTPEPV